METLKIEVKKFEEELTAFEAIEQAQLQKKTICNLKEVDEEVSKTGGAYWTGTLISHAKPGGVLGASAEFGGLTLNIPKKFQTLDSSKCILIDHPFYSIKGKTITIDDESKVRIEDMPEKDGWGGVNADCFPNQKKTETKKDRFLYRRDDGAYTGLVVRWDYYFVGRRRVDCFFRPDFRFRVLVK